jgi:adenosylhomocysteine nucleosidase
MPSRFSLLAQVLGTFLLPAALLCHSPAQAAPEPQPKPQAHGKGCLTDCTPRIGIVSAFGAEADLLVAQTQSRRSYLVNGNRFTTGLLRGNRVVIVLSGVSMINSTMVTQLMLNHFRIERLVMSGIAGGLNPALNVGDVTVPDRWIMPMEVYWSHNSEVPRPCGAALGDMSCLGLKFAMRKDANGQVTPQPPPFELSSAGGKVPTGLFMRENFVMTANNSPQGEYKFAYPVDAAMLAVARTLNPKLSQCGGAPSAAPDPKRCMKHIPKMVVGGAGVSGTAFLANADYRKYLFENLQANTFEMETAALAHVAYANAVPYIAFRSLSDLAGGEEFNADVAALFTSGLAETNEAAVTLAFLEAWKARSSPVNALKAKP